LTLLKPPSLTYRDSVHNKRQSAPSKMQWSICPHFSGWLLVTLKLKLWLQHLAFAKVYPNKK